MLKKFFENQKLTAANNYNIFQPSQESYELQGWKNTRDDIYGYDNEYPQSNQDQMVNVIYPSGRASLRNNLDNSYDASQVGVQSSLRNPQEMENQGQVVYKATISEPGREEMGTQKIKRQIRDKKENAEDIKEQKVLINNQQESCENKEQNIVKNQNKKRSVPNWSNQQIAALKNSLTLLQENKEEFNNLKTILTDMGLIINPEFKRDVTDVEKSEIVDNEDENINLNDITMLKSRKWERNDKILPNEVLDKRDLHEKNINTKKMVKSRSNKVKHHKNRDSEQSKHTKHIKEETEDDDEETERKKRDSEESNSDLMKGLEKSGDISISGNKSPLVAVEKKCEENENEKSGNALNNQATDKRSTERDDYEEEIENEIQAKIDAIKEKVKREILLEKQKQFRNKREITLLDIENKNINPTVIAHDEELQPHLRIRRKIEDNSSNITKSDNNKPEKREEIESKLKKSEDIKDDKNENEVEQLNLHKDGVIARREPMKKRYKRNDNEATDCSKTNQFLHKKSNENFNNYVNTKRRNTDVNQETLKASEIRQYTKQRNKRETIQEGLNKTISELITPKESFDYDNKNDIFNENSDGIQHINRKLVKRQIKENEATERSKVNDKIINDNNKNNKRNVLEKFSILPEQVAIEKYSKKDFKKITNDQGLPRRASTELEDEESFDRPEYENYDKTMKLNQDKLDNDYGTEELNENNEDLLPKKRVKRTSDDEDIPEDFKTWDFTQEDLKEEQDLNENAFKRSKFKETDEIQKSPEIGQYKRKGNLKENIFSEDDKSEQVLKKSNQKLNENRKINEESFHEKEQLQEKRDKRKIKEKGEFINEKTVKNKFKKSTEYKTNNNEENDEEKRTKEFKNDIVEVKNIPERIHYRTFKRKRTKRKLNNEDSQDDESEDLKQKKSSKELEDSESDYEEDKRSSDYTEDIEDSLPSERIQRNTFRNKRANNVLPENKMIFRPYMSQQDEEEENEGEGEFDNNYDQTYLEKREIYEPDFQYFEKDSEANNYQTFETAPYIGGLPNEHRNKRSHTSYIQEPYENYRPLIRKRRSKFNKRNRYKRDKIQRKQRTQENSQNNDGENNDNDFFGGLSQNYQEGELNRYKRIKRNTNETNLRVFT